MAKSNPPRIAILGAGPIGLEAGAQAKLLKLPFAIYERGRLAEHVQRWGHVKMFSPFGMNRTDVGRDAILTAKPQHAFPANDAYLTGRETVAAYWQPLADALGSIQTETHVLRIGRQDFFKMDGPGDARRTTSPFRLLLRDKANKERIEEADVILDCTGVYGQHRWAGAGGIPAPGELQAEAQIAYGLEDILGDRKNHYANKSTLVVGSGYSAATSVSLLADLALEQQTTWTIWLSRDDASTPLRRLANDPLKERDRLAAKANNIAARQDHNVTFHPGAVLEAIESLGQDKGFRVTTRGVPKIRTLEVERIIANVGYTPDTNLYRELQVHECFASLAPMKLGAKLLEFRGQDSPKTADAELLRNPEPNFFVLGAKSYGRHSNFLLRAGFEQVRAVFGLIRAT